MTRNPDAFKPKFNQEEKSKKTDSKKHQRGCNCQKSGCLKKYCECYQMGVGCSDLCRCLGCLNCPHSESTKDSYLGKRKRSIRPLTEVNKVQILAESEPSFHSYEKPSMSRSESSMSIKIPTSSLLSQTSSKGRYFVKPRKAKENRYMKFDDYSVELGCKKS